MEGWYGYPQKNWRCQKAAPRSCCRNLWVPIGSRRRYRNALTTSWSFPKYSCRDAFTTRFHISLLQPYVENDDELFPNREQPELYDFGAPADDEWQVDSIIAHRWMGSKIEFQVRWDLGDTTWEKFNAVKLLSALDNYYTLHGVKQWQQLPKQAPAEADA
ncbi:hypothetical protein DFH07DRAFT_760054 [Mycena maculata]|uniref:Chromo domain-containing protein n=1 Tax=Mycena maculata TaxID=230809 RepID=A0AAD7MM05_9AGAR|nr:hypothetical protein DFH07DRAFT_760054 [Mycena maculata]